MAGWQFVHMHLRTGVDVLYSDIDTAWLRDPRPYFHEQPYADVMTSTDCLSHKYEGGGSLQLPVSNWGGELATQKFAGTWPRCGHTPGDYSGIGFNAGRVFVPPKIPVAFDQAATTCLRKGVILLRSRPATINFMERWEADMLKFEAPRDGHQAEGLHDMTDQESLIKVLTRGIHPIKVIIP